MQDYIIFTDSSADMPKEYFEEHGVYSMSLSYIIDGVTYSNDNGLPYKEFYDKMRNGCMPTSSQVNPDQAREAFLEGLKESKNILCLAFSSGLSGTYNSERIAAEELMEEMPDVNIKVIDTLAASMGQGLLVYKAVQMKEEGKSLDEVAAWVEEHKQNFGHAVTVNDLFHLYRGGRLSKGKAIVGTMINLKPIIMVNEEGKLINIHNVRGRKKSLTSIVDYMESKLGSYKDKNDIVFISHGDCIEDAQFVADLIKERLGIEKFMINPIGPTIGTHTGPDVIALFYMADEK